MFSLSLSSQLIEKTGFFIIERKAETLAISQNILLYVWHDDRPSENELTSILFFICD